MEGTLQGSLVGSARALTISASTIRPTLVVCGENGQRLVAIEPSGEVTFGEGYEPAEAAKRFWDALGLERKARA